MNRNLMIAHLLRHSLIPPDELLSASTHDLRSLMILTNGGPGSGNFGHSGVPGQVGGSGPGASGTSPIPKATKRQKLTIDSATNLAASRGIKLDFSSGSYDFKSKSTSYELTDSSGNKKRMSAKEIHSFLMTDKRSLA